jgi:Winged helix DNA-binding domain
MVSAVRRVGAEERQARLAVRHHLAPGARAATAAEVARDLVGMPALDPTVMGWSERGWFLAGHGPALFDRTGNAGPTVWWDGRVVGGWAQCRDGKIAFRLLEDVGADAAAAAEAAAERLRAWLGPVRVTPRFRTPLERELCA